MKEGRAFFFLVLISWLIFSFSITYAQQHPNDPGGPDSVFFTPNDPVELYYPLPSGPGLGFIHIFFTNDDSVSGISAPFIFSGPVVYDSVSFKNSRIEYLLYKTVNTDLIGQKMILLGAIPVEEDIIGPGRGYLATLCFSITGYTDTVRVDTVFFPPTNHLIFVTLEPKGYTPIFTKGVFPVVPFWPGDSNHDMIVNVTDVIYLINYLFKSGPPPYPIVAADVNADCIVNITDVIYLINYLFKGGPAPKPGCVW